MYTAGCHALCAIKIRVLELQIKWCLLNLKICTSNLILLLYFHIIHELMSTFLWICITNGLPEIFDKVSRQIFNTVHVVMFKGNLWLLQSWYFSPASDGASPVTFSPQSLESNSLNELLEWCIMGRTRVVPKPCRQCHLRGEKAWNKHMVYSILLSLGGNGDERYRERFH